MATASYVQLLPELVDETARSRRREAAMASVILHLAVVILILVNPKFLQFLQRKPVSAELAEEAARRQLTLLYIPSDLLKLPEPKKEELTPEERKRAVIRTPFTVDPRALQFVLPPLRLPEAELPGEGPALTPGGRELAGRAGAPEGEDEARRAGRGNEALEERREQTARLENVPAPGAGAPKLELPRGTAGRAIEESLRAGAARQGQQPGGPGGGLPVVPNLNTPYPIILSDTRGVDFGPYLMRLLYEVRNNWYAVIPEAARLGRKGRVVIIFSILQDGSVPLGEPTLVRSSEFLPFDRAAMGAIRAAQPFPRLPKDFTGEHIVLQFTFLYNLPLDYQEP